MTTTVSLFDELQTKRNQRADKLNADYRKLVDDLVAGRKPNAEKADELLADLDKTMDDLKADVDRRVRRIEQKALVARLPEFERTIAALDAKIAEANRVLEAAQAAYDSAVYPLSESRREVCELQREASMAKSELPETCDDPALLRERDSIDAELNKVESLIPKVRDNAEVSERESKRYKQRAATEIRAEGNKSIESLAEKYQGDAENYRTELRRLEREANALRKRRDALRAKMMQA